MTEKNHYMAMAAVPRKRLRESLGYFKSPEGPVVDDVPLQAVAGIHGGFMQTCLP